MKMGRVKSKKYTGVYLNRLSDGDISYQITYKDIENKKVWFTVGKKSQGITEKYAHNKRIEFINQIRLGDDPLKEKKRKKEKAITFDEIANKFYEEREGINKENKKMLTRYTNHIKPYIGNKDITKITPADIKKLQRDKLKEGYAPKTINGFISQIHSIFEHAINEEITAFNPATTKKVPRLKVDNQRERFLTKNEINQLLEVIRDKEDVYLFVLLALNTGARLNAICSLRKMDVDLTHKIVNLLDEKGTDTYRGFLEHPELLNILDKRLKELKPTDLILQHNENIKALDKHIQHQLQPVLDELFNKGIDKSDRKNRVVIHTLRHTFASHLAINGTPIYTIQKLMNHKDINMTLRYAKLAPDSGREAVKSLFS